MLPRILLVIVLVALAARSIAADTTPGDAMIEKYLARKTDELSKKFMDGATTIEEWKAKRDRLRQEFLDMLGLWPLPPRTRLNVKITGTVDRGDVLIDKLHYQSKPGLYVTANLYRPKKKTTEKLPGVLYVCGHSGKGRDGNKTAFQDHGMWFASNGYICLVVDTLQLGEIAGIHHGTYSQGRWWWQALGYTPAGVECWNGIRGLDYLASRPDVDADKLVVTGISGGGATTMWVAAADERVKCAVPVSGMSDLESYVKNKVINGHCDCMFILNTYQWEWTTIAALIAPRPLLFANSDKDGIFPMDGNRRIIERLRKLYKMYGKPDLVDEYVSVGGHDYRPDLRLAIFGFINKHTASGGRKPPEEVKDADFKPLPGKELRIFPEDSDVPMDAINVKIDETFVARAKVELPADGKFEAWKSGLMRQLREKSRFPLLMPNAVIYGGKVGWFTMMSLETEPGIDIGNDCHLTRRISEEDKVAWVVVVDSRDVPWSVPEWAKAVVRKDPALVIAPRGTHSSAWTMKSPPNYVERSHALLGMTVDQNRVLDIAASVGAMIAETKGKVSWRVIGRGQAGVLSAYAALCDRSISEVVIIDPPVSHRDGPIFLNVLRVCDIPDALGMLAPRKLTLINAKDKAFDRTVEIYKRAGAADKLTRK